MTTRQPLALESLRIATPCKADWDEMSGSERVRFCGQCEKNVYNVSAMSRDEAEALVQDKEGRVCLRLYRRSDGTVITSDCPVGVRRQRLGARVWATISGAATSAALLLGLLSGRARADLAVAAVKQPAPHTQRPMTMGEPVAPVAPPKPAKPPQHLMGKIAMPEPAPKKKTPEPEALMGDVSPN